MAIKEELHSAAGIEVDKQIPTVAQDEDEAVEHES
jgi:hypothetical protein